MAIRAALLKVEPPTTNLPSDSFCTMYRFWLSAKGSAELPHESAVDAGKFPIFATPHLCLSVVWPGSERYVTKIVGEALMQAVGVTSLEQYADLAQNATPVERLDICVRARQAYFFSSPVTWASGEYSTYAALILPYADSGRVSRLLTYAEFA